MKHQKVAVLLCGLSLLVSSNPVFAESFKILGSRPLGMGGAFVAVAEDSLAQYWNPAGIAGQKNVDVEIPVNVRAEFTGGILKDVNTVSDLATKYSAVKTAQTNGSGIDADQLSSLFTTVKTLDGLNQPDKGALVEAQTGLNVRVMRLGISVNNFTSAGASPFVDTVNIGLGNASGVNGVSFSGANTAAPTNADLLTARNDVQSAIDTVGYSNLQGLIGAAGLAAGGITNSQELANVLVNQAATNGLSNAQILSVATDLKNNAESVKPLVASAASANPYSSNTSNVTLRGISLFEVGMGYAHSFFLKDLYLGGNVKILHGTVGYFQKQFLNEKVEGDDIADDFNNNTKQSIQPGIDLGLLYDKRETWRVKFGLVGRNLNFPQFDQPTAAAGEGKYRVEPQVRAGVALYPLKRKFWVIASDLDITNNITPVPGYSSRMWALGTEVNLVNSNLLNLAARAGITANLAEKDSKLAYTGGVGLKLLHFFVDLSGAVSSQTEEIKSGVADSQKVPQNAQVGLTLGFNF